jgi:hypothetical protein
MARVSVLDPNTRELVDGLVKPVLRAGSVNRLSELLNRHFKVKAWKNRFIPTDSIRHFLMMQRDL